MLTLSSARGRAPLALPGIGGQWIWVLGLTVLLWPRWVQAQVPKPAEAKPAETRPAETQPAQGAGDAAAGKQATKPGEGEAEVPGEPAGEIPPDPSQTFRSASVEIFKDPVAEELLDLKKFTPIRNRLASPSDLERFRVMAADANQPIDRQVIRRVVDAMITQLTETRNIQAIIDPPPGLPSNSPTARAIHEATTTLLEPIFVARNIQNTRFQSEYHRVLLERLQPVLKHHLIPRIQAMIVLGQSGNADALKLYLDEIRNPEQTVWVKLWALRGITNIKQFSQVRLTAAQEIEAARVVAELLGNPDLPWPVQYRALETLAALRQGFLPTSPRTADMAAVAMGILADSRRHPVVRAEAARALGMMQITSAVPGYNYELVAHWIGVLAADLGEEIVANYSETGAPRNATKAEHLSSLLAGPLYQAFDGVKDVRDSGLLNGNVGAAKGAVQKVLDQIKPMAQAAFELVRAPSGQLAARRRDLAARTAALREFLAASEPADHHLVPGGPEYLAVDRRQAAAAAAVAADVASVVASPASPRGR